MVMFDQKAVKYAEKKREYEVLSGVQNNYFSIIRKILC